MKSKTTSEMPKPTDEDIARMVTAPSIHAAAVIVPWSKATFGESNHVEAITVEIREMNAKLAKGDMSTVENMLFDQAIALQTMFTALSRRSIVQEYLPQYKTYLLLALKAQAQCRVTLQSLAEIKNPRPVAFFKQANISNGPQQVNNGVANSAESNLAREKKTSVQANELSGENHELLPDTGTSRETSGTHPRDKAMAKINRAD
jgi:hypothetical protein